MQLAERRFTDPNSLLLASQGLGDGYTIPMEKAMAPHSSTLAWKIPGMGEPGGLPSMGSHRVRLD